MLGNALGLTLVSGKPQNSSETRCKSKYIAALNIPVKTRAASSAKREKGHLTSITIGI
jgi:hypothetical protein